MNEGTQLYIARGPYLVLLCLFNCKTFFGQCPSKQNIHYLSYCNPQFYINIPCSSIRSECKLNYKLYFDRFLCFKKQLFVISVQLLHSSHSCALQSKYGGFLLFIWRRIVMDETFYQVNQLLVKKNPH